MYQQIQTILSAGLDKDCPLPAAAEAALAAAGGAEGGEKAAEAAARAMAEGGLLDG
jgi:hypothetical protein